jgi:hypothetical protein
MEKQHRTLTLYILSQKAILAIGTEEWIDIKTDTNKLSIEEYARAIKAQYPYAILGMREVSETEIEINYDA